MKLNYKNFYDYYILVPHLKKINGNFWLLEMFFSKLIFIRKFKKLNLKNFKILKPFGCLPLT